MIIGTKIEFENLADFILRDYLGNKYDSYIPFDVQAFAEDYLKLEISYTKFEQEQNIEGLRTGNQIILDHRLISQSLTSVVTILLTGKTQPMSLIKSSTTALKVSTKS